MQTDVKWNAGKQEAKGKKGRGRERKRKSARCLLAEAVGKLIC